MSAKGYYVYYDDENTPYFLDPTTGESTYEYPIGGLIFDPESREQWTPPEGYVIPEAPEPQPEPEAPAASETPEEPVENPEPEQPDEENNEIAEEEQAEEPQEQERSPYENPGGDVNVSENLTLDVPTQVSNFRPTVSRRAQTVLVGADKNKAQRVVPQDEDVSHFIDSELASQIHQFQIQDFAKKYFREHRSKQVFNRKRIAVEQLVSFTPEPLDEPLLEALDKNLTKTALLCFKHILQYTGVMPSKAPLAAAESIVNQLYTYPALRDEVFFQLIKQTSHTPNNTILSKGMELFLIIATIFPSTRNSENWIKAHLVGMSHHPDILIAAVAQFTYIRFAARCAVGIPRESNEIGYVKKIPMQVSMGWQTFGSSIYEMMWNQRTKEPKLPIPFIEYYMADFLLKRGAAKTEGIFRLPGSLKKVDEMALGTNDGKDMISKADLHDIASLFKKWFRDIPNPVVPIDRVNDLMNVFDDGKQEYIQFSESLPRPHKMVLKYLIGFLQELTRSEEYTKMTAKNLAIVFGPNIVQSHDVTSQDMVRKFTDVAIDFMVFLIENWDTSEIYPMRREYLACPPPDMP
ncbi:RhoGAP domain containing protein [Trichomonas vaginalis G3]|uniref:RhoGAP domain containing protein n=1 Tax=Trichomonas vaginalis (strain ATCC PRA-98 / G3) TaxID=412133 RepID=A2GDD4_TRIV3|nr:GTPase activator protein [Trichomonas vaginalis G3]EAX84836.1 RhoGAP domain containing protein [Trichomonas vaginalis G3]KAI5504438.1 GTPase activator protein [Trichomonas vaginalis G3]|eukprot:XP_001297766.1 RhoGAP domain containing protein [Trichomonas vaginalis G3]